MNVVLNIFLYLCNLLWDIVGCYEKNKIPIHVECACDVVFFVRYVEENQLFARR